MARKKKGSKGKGKAKRGKKGQIPLEVLQNRLGKLSTIVAKRGGKLPRHYT